MAITGGVTHRERYPRVAASIGGREAGGKRDNRGKGKRVNRMEISGRTGKGENLVNWNHVDPGGVNNERP